MKHRQILLALTLCIASTSLLLVACDTKVKPENSATKNIGIKYEDFANRFNAKASEFIIAENHEFTVKPNSASADLSYNFNPSTGMNVTMDKKNHKIERLYFIKAVGGDNDEEKLKSLLDAPVIASIATQALNPTIPAAQVGKIVLNLFEDASKHHNTEKATVINGIKYAAKFDTEFKAYVYAVQP